MMFPEAEWTIPDEFRNAYLAGQEVKLPSVELKPSRGILTGRQLTIVEVGPMLGRGPVEYGPMSRSEASVFSDNLIRQINAQWMKLYAEREAQKPSSLPPDMQRWIQATMILYKDASQDPKMLTAVAKMLYSVHGILKEGKTPAITVQPL